MIGLILLVVKIVLFSVVAIYVLFPDFVDSDYGYLVVLVVVVLVFLMAFDGVAALKRVRGKRG